MRKLASKTLLILAGLLWLSGCNRGLLFNGYDREIVAAQAEKQEVIREFMALFPGSDGSVLGTKKDPAWSSKALVYGRYVVRLRVPFDFPTNDLHNIKFRDPSFSVAEIEDVDMGSSHIRYSDHQMHFELKKWKELYRAHGDFNVIGYPTIKDEPVKNLELVWKAA